MGQDDAPGRTVGEASGHRGARNGDRRARLLDARLHGRLRGLAPLALLREQPVGDVVLVDVADVGDRLAPDALGRDLLDVAEPDIRVEAALLRFTPQLADPARPRVVGREREQPLVQLVHRFVLEVLVDHEPHVLHAGVDVGLESA